MGIKYMAVGGQVCDQGDALIRRERAIDQLVPHCVAVFEKSADIHFVPGLNHTSCTIFAEHLDVAELPGPSIAVSPSTTRPSNLNG